MESCEDLLKHYEAVLDTVSDAVIMVDSQMRVMGANQATEGICGVAMADIGGQVYSDTSPLCSKKCYEIFSRTLVENVGLSGHRIECAHVKCNHQTVSINSSPINDQDGNLTGAVIVIRDITMLSDLQKALRKRHRFHNIIGRSKKMQDVYELLENLTHLDTAVLVTGESGTGKALAAKVLHYQGRRALQPFITVSCSGLSETLLASELFGHAHGAPDSAVNVKTGRFEEAEGGTLFLSEIGELPPAIQLKLLRVLQEKALQRAGESGPRKVDVRVIACTSGDLEQQVADGAFNEALYDHLKAVQVSVPPLRERLDDMPLMVDHFITAFNKKFQQDIHGVSHEVLSLFMAYHWPGNVRELAYTLEHAFILCRGPLIILSDLPRDIIEAVGQQRNPAADLQPARRRVGLKQIRDALEKTDGNKAKAARLLGINRRTLYRKLDRQG